MKRIIITAGHSGPGTGAASQWMDEGEEAIVLRDMISAELRALGVEVINEPNAWSLRNVIAWLRRQLFTEETILVDIHFNAGPPLATGTEVYIQNEYSPKERRIADALSKITSRICHVANRGVKTAKSSQHNRLGILEDTKTTSVLWEVCFLSNAYDVKKYQTNKAVLAQKAASILKNLTL